MPARRCTAPTRSGRCRSSAGAGAVFRPGRGHRQHHACCGRDQHRPRTTTDARWAPAAAPARAWKSRSWTRPAADGPGETGEICVRGPAVFAGYFDNPEANDKAFRGGWFHTGDLGHLDARGFLYITGRASDMYISGGSNVYPREVEEAILTHPAVLECAVVGVPHPRWGESGVAARGGPPRPGGDGSRGAGPPRTSGCPATSNRCRVVVWDALPKSGYGKIPKRMVQDRLREEGIGF